MSGHRYVIEVTAEDIAKARRNDSYKCVVAQAIARTVPDVSHIDVDTQTIRFTQKGERMIFLTPYGVQLYVIAFDAGDPIEPFSFGLRGAVRTRRRITTEAGKQKSRERTRARRAAALERERPSTGVHERDTDRASIHAPQFKPTGASGGPFQVSDRGGRRPVPRVFKTKRRNYGQRVLRVNRQRGEATAVIS